MRATSFQRAWGAGGGRVRGDGAVGRGGGPGRLATAPRSMQPAPGTGVEPRPHACGVGWWTWNRLPRCIGGDTPADHVRGVTDIAGAFAVGRWEGGGARGGAGYRDTYARANWWAGADPLRHTTAWLATTAAAADGGGGSRGGSAYCLWQREVGWGGERPVARKNSLRVVHRARFGWLWARREAAAGDGGWAGVPGSRSAAALRRLVERASGPPAGAAHHVLLAPRSPLPTLFRWLFFRRRRPSPKHKSDLACIGCMRKHP